MWPINPVRVTADDEAMTSSKVAPDGRVDATASRTAEFEVSGSPPASLTLIVPMYCETSRIGTTVKTLAGSVLHRDDVKFLFVDDGSPDETVRVTQAAIDANRLRQSTILRLARNTGKGGAIKAAVQHADSAHVGFVDADLSLDPAEISRALARLVATNADLVVGHRIVDNARQPKVRRFASLTFRSIARHLVPTTATDTQCAMKLFRAPVAKALFAALDTTGFAFDVELLRRADIAGMRIEDVPVAWQHQAGSRLNTVTDSFRMLREIIAIRQSLRGATLPYCRSSSVATRSE